MRLENITWKQAEKYFTKHDTVMIVTGSIESHGSHLSLGTDYLIPKYLIDQMDDLTGLLIAPPVPFGYCEKLMGYPGTISISEENLFNYLKDMVDGFIKHGAKKFVFLNGHGGNINTLSKLCLYLDGLDLLGSIFNWWKIAGRLYPEWAGGHGGAQETSAILYINPSLVDEKAIQALSFKALNTEYEQTGFSSAKFQEIDFMLPRYTHKITDSGWIGNDHPGLANKAIGQKMLAATCDYLLDFIKFFSKIDV